MKTLSIQFVLFFNYYGIVIGNGDQSAGPGQPTQYSVMSFSSLWLMELEENYKSGFPKQFSVINHRNLSTAPNHNLRREDESTCQDVTFFSVEQNKRMINTFGLDSILNRTIQEMLGNPRARLFRDNFDGEIEDYRYSRGNRRGFCTELVQLKRRVESVYTFGKCVRLFETIECGGWSVAVYPGSINSAKLMRPKVVTFQAIGPCLENEFSGGYLNLSFPRIILKNPKSRSFNTDSSIMPNTLTKLPWRSFEGVTYNYEFGPGNRIKHIKAFNHDPHRDSLHVTVWKENATFMKYREGNSDVLGYTIPPNFGGTEEKFNRFPADQSSLNRWYAVLARFLIGSWYVLSSFVYEDEITTMPMYFYFSIVNHNNSVGKVPDWKYFYGRITIEHTTIWNVEQPYIQAVERNNDININLSSIEEKFSSIFRVELISKNYSGSYFIKPAGIHQMSLVHCQQAFSNQEFQQFAENVSVWQQFEKDIDAYPMVRLFSGENFTGHFENFHSGLEEGQRECYNTRRLRHVKSAVTLNQCARLFEHSNCRGLSLVIYPKILNLIVPIDKILKNVSSVGHCLVKDFLRQENESAIPGIVEIFETTPYEREDLSIPGLTIHYRLGRNERIEAINAIVNQHGLVPAGKRINDNGNAFNNSRYMTTGYVPRYVIPFAIGGPSNKSYNVFPMLRSVSEDWPEIFPSNLSDLNEFISWEMSFKFVYETESNTTAIYIYYHFTNLITNYVYYGTFVNK